MITFKDSHGNIIQRPKGENVQWRISGYAVIKNKDDHFLMVQSGSGLWHFPGGGIEIDEDIFEGIQRELREETGYKIKIDPQIRYLNEQAFYHKRERVFYHSLQLFFVAHLTSLKPDINLITAHDMIRKPSWKDLDVLPSEHMHETVRELVQKIICNGDTI